MHMPKCLLFSQLEMVVAGTTNSGDRAALINQAFRLINGN